MYYFLNLFCIGKKGFFIFSLKLSIVLFKENDVIFLNLLKFIFLKTFSGFSNISLLFIFIFFSLLTEEFFTSQSNQNLVNNKRP